MSMLVDDVVLCIDPSINTAGYAILKEKKMPRVKNDYPWHLFSCGCIKGRGDDAHHKIRYIAQTLKNICVENNVTHALVEMPPEMIYLGDIEKLPKERRNQTILARASRVMKLFSSGNYYMGRLDEIGIKARPILPVSWQQHHTKRKGRDVKSWSIDHANAFLKSEGISKKLSSGLGEHTADAINIGFMVLNAGRAGGLNG